MLCALDERPRLTKFDGLEWRKRAVRASYQDELTLGSSRLFVFYIQPAVFDLPESTEGSDFRSAEKRYRNMTFF